MLPGIQGIQPKEEEVNLLRDQAKFGNASISSWHWLFDRTGRMCIYQHSLFECTAMRQNDPHACAFRLKLNCTCNGEQQASRDASFKIK